MPTGDARRVRVGSVWHTGRFPGARTADRDVCMAASTGPIRGAHDTRRLQHELCVSKHICRCMCVTVLLLTTNHHSY